MRIMHAPTTERMAQATFAYLRPWLAHAPGSCVIHALDKLSSKAQVRLIFRCAGVMPTACPEIRQHNVEKCLVTFQVPAAAADDSKRISRIAKEVRELLLEQWRLVLKQNPLSCGVVAYCCCDSFADEMPKFIDVCSHDRAAAVQPSHIVQVKPRHQSHPRSTSQAARATRARAIRRSGDKWCSVGSSLS